MIFTDINTVYVNLVERISQAERVPGVTSAGSITSNFGEHPRDSYELRGVSFTVTDPRRRLVTVPARNLAGNQFAVANFLWMLAGRDDHEWISQFNPKGAGLAQDGHYPGAHGRRIGPQLARVISLLREDPTTRRAVLLVAREEDLFTHNRDVPCVIALQLFLRSGKLEAVCHMRSQNLLYVFPYDFFAFTMLQEVVAACIGADVGPYTHQVGSLHAFEGDEGMMERVQKLPYKEAHAMEVMPPIADLDDLVHHLFHWHPSNLSSYWADLAGDVLHA